MTSSAHFKHFSSSSFPFVRHGETDWNKQGRIMGSQDIPLNEEGKRQACTLQNLCQAYEINQIFYSPLKRAKETAQIAIKCLEIPMKPLDELKEWHWGDIEGITPLKTSGFLPKFNGKTLSEWAQNTEHIHAESETTFLNRVHKALEIILSTEEFSLVVNHGGVFKAFCKILDCFYEPLGNCSTVLFSPILENQSACPKWKVSYINEVLSPIE